MKRRLELLALCCLAACVGRAETPRPASEALSPQALVEIVPLALDAAKIYDRATARQRAHEKALRDKGLAEVPPSEAERHVVELSGLGELIFDDWGEWSIDRRFVTDDEMKTVRAIEAWIARWFPSETKARKTNPSRRSKVAGVPVFCGFEAPRYQQHDALVARLVAEFNTNKVAACGGTAEQAKRIADLTPALVKAHMIEESGGNDPRSKAAWAVDPLQVNVPGDWGDEKKLVGLAKPAKRNEGALEQNVRAAIRYLARKGFSTGARPASERPKGAFAGWKQALQRYNGRRDRTETDRYYSDEYADKILRRAKRPDVFEPIEIQLKSAK